MTIPSQFRLLAGVSVVVALVLFGIWVGELDGDRRAAACELAHQTARAAGAEDTLARADQLARKDEGTAATVARDSQAGRHQFETIQRGISHVETGRSVVRVPPDLTRLWQCADRSANPGAAPCGDSGVHGDLRQGGGVHTDHAGGVAVGEGSDGGPCGEDGALPGVRAPSGLPGAVDQEREGSC